MVPIGVILRQHFPVGGVTVLDPTGGEFDLHLRREIARSVDELYGGAKMFLKRNAGRTETSKHKTAITGDARGGGQTIGFFVKDTIVASGVGHAQKCTAQVIRPAVIRTGEDPR